MEQDVRDSGVSHCEIETEFDNMLLRRDGKDPLHFLTASHIHPSMERAKVIAPFYQGITILQAYDAMKGMVAQAAAGLQPGQALGGADRHESRG